MVTGARAEFGLLEPVMRAIAAERRLRLRCVVAGLHLDTGTWRDVRAAGFTIDARVPMQRRGETGRAADAKAVARGIDGFTRAFAGLRPDVVLVLGDRIEAFAAASAASIGGHRVAHLHAGDRAEGVADEAMRHAISKLAHLHLPATAESRRRLIRMGEPPERVVTVGSPAMDGLRGVEPAPDAPPILVLQHPIGERDAQERRWMAGTLAAVRDTLPTLEVTSEPRALVIGPNHDPGSAGIRAAVHNLLGPVPRSLATVANGPTITRATGAHVVPPSPRPSPGARGRKPDRFAFIEHVPRARFLSLLAGARVLVGNSSAGLIEAAALGVPCVNVGPRQAGRQRPRHVIDCAYGRHAVRDAIARALRLDLRRLRHPYGDGRTGPRVAELLASLDLEAIPLRKHNAY